MYLAASPLQIFNLDIEHLYKVHIFVVGCCTRDLESTGEELTKRTRLLYRQLRG